jgi:HEAT repeat protein
VAVVPPNIEATIQDLTNEEKALANTGLADLSNLDGAQLSLLAQTWNNVQTERRRKIATRLVELAEENFELNFDGIFKHALKDPDPEVRVKAIEGLWENEETTMITPYIKLLNDDRSEIVQAAAARALSKYAMLAELKRLGSYSSGKVVQALLAILKDKTRPAEVWRKSLEAAAPLTLPEVKQAIEEAYQSPDIKTKNSAIFAMGKNCDASWLPTLYKEMGSLNADTRFEAAGACGEICDEEAVPYLIKLTQDKDPEVQEEAILALGKIGGVKARSHLLKCLNSADENVSEAAQAALRQIETESDSFIS